MITFNLYSMSVKKLFTRLSVLLVMLLSCVATFAQDEQEVTYPVITGLGNGKFIITVNSAGQINGMDLSSETYSALATATELRIVCEDDAELSGADMTKLCSSAFSMSTLDLENAEIANITEDNTTNNLYKLNNAPETLKNIVFPKQAGMFIPNECFKRNTKIESIIIPDNNGSYKFSTGAFEQATGLKRISIGKGTKSIGGDPIPVPTDGTILGPYDQIWYQSGVGAGVFQNCTNLYSVVLPEGLECIRGNAFQNCSSIEYLQLPEGLTTIGGNAFDRCSKISVVTIPSTMRHFGGNAFAEMSSLTDVYLLAEDIPLTLAGDQGGPFNIAQTTNFRYSAGNNPTYSAADYTSTQGGQTTYTMAILHYPGTETAIERYRWQDATGYNLVDENGTTWPDQEDIGQFNTAKNNFDRNDPYIGWKFFLQGEQNEKTDKIYPETRFKESRWYSVCYPFDVTIDKFQNTFGARAALSEFSGITYDETTNTMTIRFEKPAINWATNDVILKKDHAYMIHPDKFVVKDDATGEYTPLQIFNIDNNLEQYRTASVLAQRQAVIDDYNAFIEQNQNPHGPQYDKLKKKYDQWVKVKTDEEVDAINVLYNEQVWDFSATEEDNTGTTRIRHYKDKDGAMYYFKGNYVKNVKIPPYCYYLGGSLAEGAQWPFGFYYTISEGNTWTPYTCILAPDADTDAGAKEFSFASFNFEDVVVENKEGQQATTIDNELFVRIPVKATGKVYNMQGQQVGTNGVEGLSKGLYIVNGKKYIVK